jgi:IclR family acetate operon transcriptional repressor
MSSSGTPRTRSLDKAVTLLHGLSRGAVSASALARDTGIPRATVARTLWTLADAGLVEETEDGWILGYELVRLGRAADPHALHLRLARPVLASLRDAYGESALYGVPRDPTTLAILLQLDGAHLVGVSSWVGTVVPLYASAAGKLMLAELDAEDFETWLRGTPRPAFTARTIVGAEELRKELVSVRRDGFAELVDELEEGLTSISVSVRGADGSLVGMIGLSGPTARFGRRRRAELRSGALAAAQDLEARFSAAG